MANRFVPGTLFSERNSDTVEKNSKKQWWTTSPATSYQVFKAELKPDHEKTNYSNFRQNGFVY